jgi:hypothetical protein
MILDNIRRRMSRILLFALLVSLLLYSKDLLLGFPDKVEWQNSLFTVLPDFLYGRLPVIISIVLTLFSGLLIYQINFDHLSFNNREHLSILLWVIQVGGLSFFHTLSEVHFASIFILMSYNQLFHINRKTVDYDKVFLSAMYLGIATIFYNLSLYLFIPHIISLYRFKFALFRDWIISIMGFLTPFYFAIFICHFAIGNWYYPIETTVNNITPDILSLQLTDLSATQYIFCIFIFVLTIFEILTSSKSQGKGANQKTISCVRSFLGLMFVSILILLFFTPESKFMLYIIFIPTTMYIRILFFKITKNFIANSLFIAFVMLSMIALMS